MPSVPYLEHLDECDGKEEVGGIAEHQAQAEEDADGDDCPQINPSGHRHLLPRVEDGCEACQSLCDRGREDEMPCCEEDCCVRLGLG
jgi:hypothetical protein